MKIILIISVIVVSQLLTGCASTQSAAGKTIASTATIVDGAMKGWAQWVKIHGATPEQETMIRNALVKYQIGMRTAKIIYANMAETGDKSEWEKISAALTGSRTELLQLIAAFSSSTNQVQIIVQ